METKGWFKKMLNKLNNKYVYAIAAAIVVILIGYATYAHMTYRFTNSYVTSMQKLVVEQKAAGIFGHTYRVKMYHMEYNNGLPIWHYDKTQNFDKLPDIAGVYSKQK